MGLEPMRFNLPRRHNVGFTTENTQAHRGKEPAAGIVSVLPGVAKIDPNVRHPKNKNARRTKFF